MLQRIRIVIALVASSLLVSLLPAQALPASSVVTVHYQRFAGDYTGWNLWLWPSGKDGAGYSFTGTDAFGVVGTFTVPNTGASDSIGVIVRLNSWEQKDVAVDRFIKTFKADGSTEIWLVQTDPTIYYSEPKFVPQFQSVTLDDLHQITVAVNKPFTPAAGANHFTLAGPGNPSVTKVATVSGAASDLKLVLTTSTDLAIDAAYTLTHPDFGSAAVSLGGVLNSAAFNAMYTYTGNDLGNTYTATKTSFRVWAPTATEAKLLVYAGADTKELPAEFPMKADVKGTWTTSLDGDRNGTIYKYAVKVAGTWREAVDPYVRATTMNGVRGVVVDLDKTNPSSWTSAKPAFSGKPSDAVVYELHVRDLSMDANSGISAANRGKWLALTEHGTKVPGGTVATGVDAIKALGVTHVQLLPIYDYKTVDESRNDQFNWGYDPQNYNVPEGSYSTQPNVPTNRITELKQTVQSLHQDGLRVVMDVVYNHVFDADASSFQQLVPGYFFRMNADGTYGNATGCGNEVASERPMARKFIVDSVSYWAQQYHLDGFRFDLMGVLDVTTMQQVRAALDAIDPSIIVLGEGWKMGNLLTDSLKAMQTNAWKLKGIAQFDDGIRDGVKGSVFNATEGGFAQGVLNRRADVVAGIVGEIPYASGIGGVWGEINPGQTVNYVEAHDNLTLADKLVTSMPRASITERARVFRLASSIPLLAQGMPFVHAGQEFMRSKNGDDNSYKSSDAINSLKWALRAKNIDTVNYFAGLITLRKQHPAFRMSTTSAVVKNLKFLASAQSVIAYSLNGVGTGDAWKQIVVAHNASTKAVSLTLPGVATWQVVVNGAKAGVKTLQTLKAVKVVSIPAQTTMVLHN